MVPPVFIILGILGALYADSGTAVQVIVAKADRSFDIRKADLEKILLDPRIKESEVIVLSIAGAYRAGKSFLLNIFLRYLYSKGSKDWIGDPEAPLTGFHWRAGDERCTTGILMWSEPLEVTLSNGEKACVLLMDTQGAFDSQSTVQDCATIFALSTLLSSVQVYNIRSNIEEHHLQHLRLFTEYGRLAAEGNLPKDNTPKDITMKASTSRDSSKADSGKKESLQKDSMSKDSTSINITSKDKLITSESAKPFQELYILVRDWQSPRSYEYGWTGGEKYVANKFEECQHRELDELKQHIRSCFAKIGCFLLPHPGKVVITGENYDGHFSAIDVDFQLHVKEFVSSLLSPEKLVVKEINGKKITGRELCEYFKTCTKAFKSNNALPDLRPIFEVTTDLNHLKAVSDAMNIYKERMEKVCGDKEKYIETTTLESEHETCQKEAFKLFQTKCKMGTKEKIGESNHKLEENIKILYEDYKKANLSKRVTTDLNHLKAVSDAMNIYKERMEKVCGDKKKYIETTTLESEHKACQKEAFELFQTKCKMGTKEKIGESNHKLEENIKILYEDYKKANLSKRVIDTTSDETVTALTVAGTGLGVTGVFAGVGAVYTGINAAASVALTTSLVAPPVGLGVLSGIAVTSSVVCFIKAWRA